MTESGLFIYIIKLILGGVAAFLAIMLWSRVRDAAWMAFVGGIVISYAQIVYELLLHVGIISADAVKIFGVSLTAFLFATIPTVLFIIALILLLIKHR